MNRIVPVFFFSALMLFAGPLRAAAEGEAYIYPPGCPDNWYRQSWAIPLLKSFNTLGHALVGVTPCKARVIAPDATLTRLKSDGYIVERIPSKNLKVSGTYGTWNALGRRIMEITTGAQDVATVEVVGFTAEGLPMYAVLIAGEQSSELPVIRVTGAHHGNERISTEVALGILEWTLTAAGRSWLTSFRFHIIPVVNPEGYRDDRRFNSLDVDLNRDYGFGWESGQSTDPFSQNETRAMAFQSRLRPALFQIDFHSEATYVNTVFDYTPFASSDEPLVLDFAYVYASAADLTAVIGYDWYQATGSSQDFHYGMEGHFSYTIETLEPSSPVGIVTQNMEAFAALLPTLASHSFCGRLTDALTGEGVVGRLALAGQGQPFLTDTHGFFCRFAPEGNQTISYYAPGYEAGTFDVTVPSVDFTMISLDAVPPPFLPLAVIDMGDNDTYARFPTQNWPHYALSSADGLSFSLGKDGRITLDMGYATVDDAGDEFSVYEGDVDATQESVVCSLAQYPFGPFYLVGEFSGDFTVDIAAADLPWARYLRIESTGGTITDNHPGYDLDYALNHGLPAADVDEDNDGHSPLTDCDDTDGTRAPGMPESCDNKDTNCNGLYDEGFPRDEQGQVVCTDAGVDSGDTDAGTDASVDADGGDPGPPKKDGCTCNAGHSSETSAPLLLLIAFSMLLFIRRPS
ncbi:succinylglutamate desuccinylase/aspartoacylase family protein [Myxococcota bacterium]|nr:succinylglutamate desuccinylase/aspartoacylase family protein [Myxococcota bacterium]MBU1534342.1 succinylglutamate desuccinylase/aspartoacylase family protein [Myxococcota bacterium]